MSVLKQWVSSASAWQIVNDGAAQLIAVSAGTNISTSGTVNFSNSNGVSFGMNTNGVITAAHNGLTTAAQSNHSHAFATTTTNGSNVIVATSNSNGVTLAVPPFITTAAAGGNAVTQWVAGTVTQNGANNQIVFTGSNGISVHGNGSTVSISLIDNHHIDGLAFAGNNNGTAFSQMTSGTATWSFAGAISGSQAGNGITLSAPTQTVQTQNSVLINGGSGAFSLAQSTHTHNFATTTTTGSAVNAATVNSAGVTIGMPAFLTTYAAQTADTNKVGIGNVSTIATAGSLMTGSAGTNGITLAVPAYLTTAAAGGGSVYLVAGSNSTGGTATASGVSASFGNSNNVSFYVTNGSIVANATMAAGAGDGYNAAQFTNSTADTTQPIVWAGNSNGSGNITMGLTGSTVTMSAPSGGGGVTIGGWEVFPAGNNTTASSLGQRSLYFQKLHPDVNYSFNNFELRMSNSMVTTTNNSAAVSYTLFYGLYSQDTNNSYNRISSSSMFIAGSMSSSNSAGITVSQGASSFTTQASTTVASLMSGYKHLYLPFTSTLTADGHYALAIMASSTTTGGTGALRLAFVNETVINNLTIGKIHGSTILASNSTFVGDFAQGVYSATTSALPAAVAKSQMSNAVSQARLYIQLDV
jgi:hypothetical protein